MTMRIYQDGLVREIVSWNADIGVFESHGEDGDLIRRCTSMCFLDPVSVTFVAMPNGIGVAHIVTEAPKRTLEEVYAGFQKLDGTGENSSP